MEEKKEKSLEKPEDKKPISRIKTKNFIINAGVCAVNDWCGSAR